MNQLEAIHHLKAGNTLVKQLTPEEHGVSTPLAVMIRVEQYCNFPSQYHADHVKYGPIHVRFWAGGGVKWLHITPQQLRNFIKRHYPK